MGEPVSVCDEETGQWYRVAMPHPRVRLLRRPGERTIGGKVCGRYSYRRRTIWLPIGVCHRSEWMDDIEEPADYPRDGEHDWTMPLNCMPHDYGHLAGLACWRCSEQRFFVTPFCPGGWRDWSDEYMDAKLKERDNDPGAYPAPGE